MLLHQTPRCWDEFASVMPLLDGYRVITPDLLGFGASGPAPENTIEEAAASVTGLLDALGVGEFHLVGHHFGGLVAYHVAAVVPGRVRSLVLSSTPYVDADERRRRASAEPFNVVPPVDDGAHLAALWQRRTGFLAGASHRVLSRYVRDVLDHADADRGHAAVAAYRSEDRVGAYSGPVLCVASARDPRAFPARHRIAAAFPQAGQVVLENGDISSPETVPEEFAAAIRTFHAGAGA
ncbi:alpha/beta fold hydrolase [Prauserella aidingensis]|uniref:alpha/beta fold hydrolase n=1 Tax=Prauserella aidingensis TaxID=387890 RepID=UPI0020A35D17|nr:alpha/beta fold hydrolase [Prauserella aidingensis]